MTGNATLLTQTKINLETCDTSLRNIKKNNEQNIVALAEETAHVEDLERSLKIMTIYAIGNFSALIDMTSYAKGNASILLEHIAYATNTKIRLAEMAAYATAMLMLCLKWQHTLKH